MDVWEVPQSSRSGLDRGFLMDIGPKRARLGHRVPGAPIAARQARGPEFDHSSSGPGDFQEIARCPTSRDRPQGHAVGDADLTALVSFDDRHGFDRGYESAWDSTGIDLDHCRHQRQGT
jgi:hypothetical protein